MGTVLTIPPHRPFLDSLARFLLEQNEERLVDTLLVLPSRRACLAAREAFLRASDGRTLLLPRLVPVGEPDEAELLLDPELEFALPPPLPPLRRRLLLTRLLIARGDLTLEQAVRLAGELESFLDELQTEEVALDGLDRLVPEELAEHWQEVLRFLSILRAHWPQVLAEERAIEPAERRRRLLDALAARWQKKPPQGPVVAAGITGTIPAVARLLAVIAELPQGLVVLPGLDGALSPMERAALRPVHPQWALYRLLERLGIAPEEVRELPDPAGEPAVDRAPLWRRVMRPAGAEAVNADEPPLPATSLSRLELVQARDQSEEALAIALRLREALETPGKRAVLVTADRFLARRVAAELARWGLAIDDSAGVPLDQTPPGTFFLLTARVLVEDAPPVPLLAALKHPLAQGGVGQRDFRRYVRALERALLRGPRVAGGLEGLLDELRARPADPEVWHAPVPQAELLSWLEALCAAARSARALAARPSVEPIALLDAHLAFAEWLARDPQGGPGLLWAREAGEALFAFLAELRDALPVLKTIVPAAWPAFLAVLMAGRSVRRRVPAHPRLAILGRFESRLVSADLVCVGGLVEGSWPEAAESGPWLDRRMRAALKLPPVEQAIGFAAHDFVQAASAPEVVLSWSEKDELGQPRAPSRWLVRLQAVLARARAQESVRPSRERASWPRRLDEPQGSWPRPCARPRPCPPEALRPRTLWVSDVRDLMHDPYRFYARTILALKPLEPIDAAADGTFRGKLLHEILALWCRKYPDRLPEDVSKALHTLAKQEFQQIAHHPQVFALWWPRFVELAQAFNRWEEQRRATTKRIWAELVGATTLKGHNGSFTIRARADRIELGHDGALRIIDYKSGRLPQRKEVVLGREPQLALETLIALEGGFADVPQGEVVEALLLSLTPRDGAAPEELRFAADGSGNPRVRDRRTPKELASEARDGLIRLLEHFARADTPFAPIPRPEPARRDDPFDHLARTAEWWSAEATETNP